jgi:hypothetical protein
VREDRVDDDPDVSASTISDDDLTTLALNADPHPTIDPHVAPWRPMADAVTGLLPDWYMPTPSGSHRGKGAKIAIGVIIASFVIVNALGLCITNGFLTIA